MAGERARRAISAQPAWLRQVPTDVRLPPGARVVFTGCGTSWHAAQAGGTAMQALEVALAPPAADVLVLVSHEGGSYMTWQALESFAGPKWLVTGMEEAALAEEGSMARRCDVVIRATPETETSYCHTAAYTCAVAAIRALCGEDVTWLASAVEGALEQRYEPSRHERWLVAGAGRDWPTAQEAALKLREGAHVAAEAHHTEELLHGHLAAIDESVRCFVLEGEGRAAERAREAMAALRILGCDATLVPTLHPVVDIVLFQLLAVDLAGARGVDPDVIRRDDERWARARAAYR